MDVDTSAWHKLHLHNEVSVCSPGNIVHFCIVTNTSHSAEVIKQHVLTLIDSGALCGIVDPASVIVSGE